MTALLGRDLGVCRFSLIEPHLLDCRNRARLPKEAKSVLLFVFPYRVKQTPPDNICRYAAVPDYHPLVMKRLEAYCDSLRSAFPTAVFEPFVDNSPIPEVAAACAAGLGVRGQNGLLITSEYGSDVFIGEIVTDLEVDAPDLSETCVNCGRCVKACPVELDKKRCLSAVSQRKGLLTPQESALLKQSGCVWGCDICSAVCPMNQHKALTDDQDMIDGYRNRYTLGEDITGRAYAWRGEAVIRRNADIIEKNTEE